MADDKQIELVIRARNLTDQAFQKVQAAIRDVEGASNQATSRGAADWKKFFGTITGGVAAGNLLSDAIKKVSHELVDLPNKLIALGERGADVKDVKSAFEGLTRSVGQTSSAMLGSLRSAFGGTVADFELMKTANEGLGKGVKFTSDDMGVLAKAARVMADRVGGDAKQSFDSLISGIADGRERTLKQLPLNFANIEAAVKSYADALGTEVSKLDEAQKQEALRQAVLKESQRLLAETGEIQNDFSDNVKKAAAEVRNWTDGLAESAAQFGPVMAGLGGLVQAAPGVKGAFLAMATGARAFSAALLTPVGLIAALGGAAIAFTAFKVRDVEAQAEVFGKAATIMGHAAKDIVAAQQAIAADEAGKAGIKMSGVVTMEMAEIWQRAARAAGHLKEGATTLTLQGLGPIVPATKTAVKATKEHEQALKNLLKPLHDATGGLDNLKHILPGVVDEEALQRMTALDRLTRELVPDNENWAERLDRVRGMVAALVPGLGAMNEKLADQQRKIHGVIKEAKAALAADIAKGLNFGSRLSDTIIGALKGGGDVGKSVGAFLGDEIGKNLGGKLAEAIGGKLGGAIGGILGPLGAIGGQLVGGLVDKLFGKGKGRTMVEEFADKEFGGFAKLQQRLVTLGQTEYDRLWKLLNTVGKNNTTQAKQAIDEVTKALQRQDAELNKAPRSFADATAAAQALGVDINRIGDGINQLRVHDTAEEIAANWEILKEAGANMDEVAEGAQAKFQALLDEALKWGHALPESMREPLQRFVDLGKATDASGEKLEDLSGIKWDEPLQDAIGGLKDSIKDLAGVIRDELGGAFRSLPTNVDVGFTSVERTDNRGTPETDASRFVARVVNGAVTRTAAAVRSAGTVVVQLGTREIARTLMPEIANEVKRLRLA